MASEAVRVVVRARPMNDKEISESRKNILNVDTSLGAVQIHNPREDEEQEAKQFTYDIVYDENSTQRSVYEEVGFPLVESVMSGYNGTMFAYGQTGCGKTHTMQGFSKDPEHRGVIPNSFEHIFENIKIANDKEFIVQASYIELYNEEIRDLLAGDPKHKLELKESADKGVYVKDLTQKTVDTVEGMEALMDKGNEHRTVGSTLMNQFSSRSHSIFSIVIEVGAKREDGSDHITRGKLNLVDLAGSERPSKTGATGARMKEGIKINLSLTALGNVISALVAGKHKHIPYRDSKLTRLLQDSLGGNTKTVMLAAVGPADYNYDETLSTLRYANRAKNIKNKPVLNEDPKDALLRQYKEEIEMLRQLLQQQLGEHQLQQLLKSGQLQNASLHPPSSSRKPNAQEKTPRGTEHAQQNDSHQESHNQTQPLEDHSNDQTQLKEPSQGHGSSEGEGEHSSENQLAKGQTLVDDNDGSQEAQQQPAKDVQGTQGEVNAQQPDTDVDERNAEHDLQDTDKDDPESLKQKLASLMGKISKGGGEGDEDPEVVVARQQHEYRRAQLKMKSQKKKEARLRAKQKQAEEEKEALETEMKNIASEAEQQSKAAKKLKSKYEKRIKQLQQELQEGEEEWVNEREGLTNTLKEQEKEIKLLEQVCSLFLKPPEMAKIWERAVWNEEAEEWTLPQIALKAARNPRNSGPAEIGAVSPMDDGSSRGSSPDSERQASQQSMLPTPSLRGQVSTSQQRVSHPSNSGQSSTLGNDTLPGINGGLSRGGGNTRLSGGQRKSHPESQAGQLPSLAPVQTNKVSSHHGSRKYYDDSSLPPTGGPQAQSRGRYLRQSDIQENTSQPRNGQQQNGNSQLPSMLPTLNGGPRGRNIPQSSGGGGLGHSQQGDNFLPTL
eukprot:gb/GECG01006397.1/.p1 GENE.gb/GECG01006397.1/~~gb/GECG01006397.1/.p1  ORF type:complete len:893 (+),score=173.61 gb/GECG01006397.1/:1-2679(+)